MLYGNNAVLDVVADCLRRSFLRGVVSKVFPLVYRLPFPGVFPACLVPADTLVLRGGAFPVLHRINGVLDVVDVRLRRSLLRGVVSKVFPLVYRLPFLACLFPADTLVLRSGAFPILYRINAVLTVDGVRLRRSLLRVVVSKA